MSDKKFRFIHSGDQHADYVQYGSSVRKQDFMDSLEKMIDYALKEDIKYILLTGDLHNDKDVTPDAFLHFQNLCQKAKKANINIIAIYGNHDAPKRDALSWIEVLDKQKMLMMLKVDFDNNGYPLLKHKDDNGCFVDIKQHGIRIYGFQFMHRPQFKKTIEFFCEHNTSDIKGNNDFVILMTHTGLEGIVPHMSGTYSKNELEPLKKHVDYLALGHIHKKYIEDDWIFNPGSLEPNDMGEKDFEGGFFDITVSNGKIEKITHKRVSERPFVAIDIIIDSVLEPEDILDITKNVVAIEKSKLLTDLLPVVEIRISGTLLISYSKLPLETVESIVKHELNPLLITRIVNKTVSEDYNVILHDDGTADTKSMEQGLYANVAASDLSLVGISEDWAKLVYEIRNLATQNVNAQDILDTFLLKRSELDADI